MYESTYQTHARGKAIDTIIDDQPTAQNIGEMIEMDELNRLAFIELESYNKHNQFLYKHPMLKRHSLTQSLDQLRRNDPEEFQKQMINTGKNIDRYNSQINNEKYKDLAELKQWESHIKTSEEKLAIMRDLISK